MILTETQLRLDAPYVELIIEGDAETPWEGGINGVFYRISRGKPVKVPLPLAKLIYANSRVRVLGEYAVKDYTHDSGKCLSNKNPRTSKGVERYDA